MRYLPQWPFYFLSEPFSNRLEIWLFLFEFSFPLNKLPFLRIEARIPDVILKIRIFHLMHDVNIPFR